MQTTTNPPQSKVLQVRSSTHWQLHAKSTATEPQKGGGTARSNVWIASVASSDAPVGNLRRSHFGIVTLDGKIVVIGGMYHHDSRQIDRPLVDVYDPRTDTWSKGEDLPTGHTHAEASTFVHNNRIHFLGGMAQVGQRRWIDNKITIGTPEGGWKHVAEAPRPLSAAAAGIIDGKLYLAGGSPNGATPQPRVWVRPAPSTQEN